MTPEEVARAHADDIYKVVARVLVGRSDLWEDVAQDALVNVLRGLPRFRDDGPASLRTWVLTIATRTAIDAHRRITRRVARHAALPTPDDLKGLSPDRVAEQRQLAAKVERAMAELPIDQRAALVLRAYHDQNYAEIAAAVGTTVAGVKQRIARAREALARAMDKGLDEGGNDGRAR